MSKLVLALVSAAIIGLLSGVAGSMFWVQHQDYVTKSELNSTQMRMVAVEKWLNQVDIRTINAERSGTIDLGKIADRTAQLERQMKIVHPRDFVGARVGEFAEGTDNWNVFLSRLVAAEKALKAGDETTARVMFINALSGMGTFCSAKIIPDYYIKPELRELVMDQFMIWPVPERPDRVYIKTNNGGC